MTFPECTDVVLGRSRRDFGSVCFLLVARGVPLGDSVKDNLGRGQSRLSKVRITNHLSLNSLPLRLQIAFCLLQLSDQPVDFCNRRGSDFLNVRRDLRVSFCFCNRRGSAFANEPSGLSVGFRLRNRRGSDFPCLYRKPCCRYDGRICCPGLRWRHRTFLHGVPIRSPSKSHFLAGELIWCERPDHLSRSKRTKARTP